MKVKNKEKSTKKPVKLNYKNKFLDYINKQGDLTESNYAEQITFNKSTLTFSPTNIVFNSS